VTQYAWQQLSAFQGMVLDLHSYSWAGCPGHHIVTSAVEGAHFALSLLCDKLLALTWKRCRGFLMLMPMYCWARGQGRYELSKWKRPLSRFTLCCRHQDNTNSMDCDVELPNSCP
jgi:hypothetical protein